MRTESEVIEGTVVVAVLDARIDGPRGGELKQVLARVIGEGHRSIVLDLGAVDFMDSTALGAIVSSLKLLGRRGDLVLCGSTEAVSTLLRLTRMDKVFRLFAVLEDAIAALAAQAQAFGG